MKTDIKAICVERGCGKEFVITVDDQDHCEGKGYPLPKRCKPCRVTKKARFDLREAQENSPFKDVYDRTRGQIGIE